MLISRTFALLLVGVTADRFFRSDELLGLRWPREKSDFHECVFRFCHDRGTGSTVWYLSGRLDGPPPTSMYELDPPGVLIGFDLLMSMNSIRFWRFCASSKLISRAPPTLRLFGRSICSESCSRCSIWLLSVDDDASNAPRSFTSSDASKIRWQFVIRYSVTTAWTPTPRRAATPPDSSAGLRSRFGAQTIARLRSVIPVRAECFAMLFRCVARYFSVLPRRK